MKKYAGMLSVLAAVATAPVGADPVLALQSGCMGCHKAEGKLLGPAFTEIAARYRADATAVETLTAKVKAGSQPGEALNWGTMQMPPSPAKADDVRTIVRWILTH